MNLIFPHLMILLYHRKDNGGDNVDELSITLNIAATLVLVFFIGAIIIES